uniref:Serine-threonine kinase receptor-associated protein n=1 Tax=Romanomermis culicivorax TaxID=13658 RepID=A0A915HJP3_ROMCU
MNGHELGEICQFDIRMNKQDRQDLTPVNFVNEHKRQITDLQLSDDQCVLLSSSKDQTAKLFDARTLEKKKTYISERPVNSAAMSPIRDHIVLGGGEEAMQVTQTDTRLGQFEAKLYHMVFEEEFARIKGHFGPINTLAFHPSGKSYASGAEDGMVRVNTFDDDYFEFDFDY